MKKDNKLYFYRLYALTYWDGDYDDWEDWDLEGEFQTIEEVREAISDWVKWQLPDIEENTYISEDGTVELDIYPERYEYIVKNIDKLIRIQKVYYNDNKECFYDYWAVCIKDDYMEFDEPIAFATEQEAKEYAEKVLSDKETEIYNHRNHTHKDRNNGKN
ncbi:hypothetical protein [[Mycoplasma] gypis]|uniref:Uncharacterized protein n=1 Tax=[Mycoplasma] gypis TaxID=92404 RepID=A0ABZ2RNK9_9BACT|nr:hypothetical protein [[Mycoplasma] gypis]MBN0919448.1 hypothetical protein [[Mycoplasma] gypis]